MFASAITSFLFLTFVSCHANIFSIFPLLPFSLREESICAPCCSEFMNLSFSCNVIFMMSVRSSFLRIHKDSLASTIQANRFVSFNNTSVFCCVQQCGNFPCYFGTMKLTKHCCWHRNFQLSTSIVHDILEFVIIKINETNTTQSSDIVELWFLDGPLLLLFAF